MTRRIIVLVALLTIAANGWSQQTIVFPAVSDEVEGRNGSLWVTVVRIIKVDPRDTIVLKRKWVCLPGGGFLDDPMPTWRMPGGERVTRVDMAWGEALLSGTGGSIGAIAYEVEGGEVLAHSYVVDVSRGEHGPDYFSAAQGQFIRAMEEPLQGPSHIPWLAGCLNSPCSSDVGVFWTYHRNNIGLINPNPEPLAINGSVIAIGTHLGRAEELRDSDPYPFSKVVPPYGWVQFNWVSDVRYGNDVFGGRFKPEGGFVISLTPDKDIPYYAYASVVFTPDPDSDIPVFNDPMFVPARPGYVAPYSEVYPKKGEGE